MNTRIKSPLGNGIGVTGKVSQYKGKPQIEITDSKMIHFGSVIKEDKSTTGKSN